MSNKGNVALLAIVVLGVVSTYLLTTLYSAASVQPFSINYKNFIVNNHHHRSALSRVIAQLQDDILASGPFIFGDLNWEISFQEMDRKEEETIVRRSSYEDGTIELSFEVLMATTIYIDFAGYINNEGEEEGYIRLYSPDGNLILARGEGEWAIDSAKWGYGDYTVIMDGSVRISYTQIVERTVNVDSHVLQVKLARGGNEVFLIEQNVSQN